MNRLKLFVGEKISYKSGDFGRWKEKLKNLTSWDVFKVSVDETVLMTRHCTLPALFCTINACCGYDNLILLWLLSVVTAYFINKKQLEEAEENEGLFSPIAMARYATFFLIVVKCSYLSSYLQFPKEFNVENFEEIPFRFLECHVKVMANVALYRFYLTFCGAFTTAARKKFQRVETVVTTTSPEGSGVAELKTCQE